MVQVLVRIDEIGADADRLDWLAIGLREDLIALDFKGVDWLRTSSPPIGSRALDPAVLGTLVVTLDNSLTFVRNLLAAVGSWLRRGEAERAVEITVGDSTLRLTNVSFDQQQRLIDEFVRAIDRK